MGLPASASRKRQGLLPRASAQGPVKSRAPLHAALKRPDEFLHELIPGVLIKIE